MALQTNVIIEKDEPIIFDDLVYEAKDFDEIGAKADGNCFWHCSKIIFDLLEGQPKYKNCGSVKNDLINTVVDIVVGNFNEIKVYIDRR